MTSDEIRKKFIGFFEKRGHAVVPSASLVPENDPTVLFNTAGMQPLVPYLLGQKHPQGNRLVNIQKCVRTNDIDEVGDNTHLTFFEMLGNWSLGDSASPDGIGKAGYFKEEAIKWSYELLTSKEEGFGLDPKRLYVTVFEGDDKAPRDEEAALIWKKYIPENRIYYRPADKNWWSPGDNGPAGPDTEMFYDLTPEGLGDMTLEQYIKADNEQKIVEIWNDVFMQYIQKDGKVVGKLEMKNVDTGSGFERMTTVIQGKDNVYETDLFVPILDKINELSTFDDNRSKRIIADHIRASVFLISDGVIPDNRDQGYVLRRLIRRCVRLADKLGMKHGSLFWIADTVIEKYKNAYPVLRIKQKEIKNEIDKEEQKFRQTLEKGMKEFERISHGSISGHDAFTLFSSFGFPFELIQDLAKEKNISVDEKIFNNELAKHQELSRAGAEQKFKGGLGGTGVTETRYHTATHLLNAALRKVLGNHVSQKGSNITAERMRFDFSHPQKMTDEEKKKVEDLVNKQIKESHYVTFKEMPKTEAEKIGAIHVFGDKYGDTVKVYSIGDEKVGYFSQEFCGGPHVSNTSELGHFKIVKEEAVSSGVRRIKAILE